MWSERDFHVDQGLAEVHKGNFCLVLDFTECKRQGYCLGGCIEAGRALPVHAFLALK